MFGMDCWTGAFKVADQKAQFEEELAGLNALLPELQAAFDVLDLDRV